MAIGHWLKDYIGPHSSVGGEIDPGYSCTETTTLLTDESVTTVADDNINSGELAYSTPIDADTIKVTFNGTEYVCDVTRGMLGKIYGAPNGADGPDFSEYPFQIASGLVNSLFTETAGTYQIKIETVEEVVETSECFKKAVISISSLIVMANETINGRVMSETWQTIHDALAKGVHVVFINDAGVYSITSAIVAGNNHLVIVADYVKDAPSVRRYVATSADSYPLVSAN